MSLASSIKHILKRLFSPCWLWIPILVGSLVGWSLPAVTVRHGRTWDNFRGERAGLPLSPAERLYQFNVDQPDWLALIADFPGYYTEDNYRINRPGYPAAVSTVCRLGQGARDFAHTFRMRDLFADCSRPQAILSGLAVNWMCLALSVFGFHHLLVHWGNSERIAGIAAAQLALSPFVLWSLASIATDLVAFAITIAVLSILSHCSQLSSHESVSDIKSIAAELLGGLGIGLLMLVKAQYDVVLTAWLALSYRRRWRTTVLTFLAHLIPILGWLVAIRLSGWTYYNPEIEVFRQVVWLWEDFIRLPLLTQLSRLVGHTQAYANYLYRAFGWVTLSLVAVGLLRFRDIWHTAGRTYLLFILPVNWLFILAIGRYYSIYVGVVFFLIYPLAASGVAWLTKRLAQGWQRVSIAIYLVSATLVAWSAFWLSEFEIAW